MINGVEKKKLVRHKDERGFFQELIRNSDSFFSEGFGQLSYSYMHHGVVKAWHVHKTQIDWWSILKGKIKAVLHDTRGDSPTKSKTEEHIMDSNVDPYILKIPPGVAHGLKVIDGPAMLVYVTSKTYNPDEEGRIPYNDKSIGYDWVQGIPITNKNIT